MDDEAGDKPTLLEVSKESDNVLDKTPEPLSEIAERERIHSIKLKENPFNKTSITSTEVTETDEQNDDERNDDERNDDARNDDERNDDERNDDERNDDERNDEVLPNLDGINATPPVSPTLTSPADNTEGMHTETLDPLQSVAPVKSPMVVSVGTIEVNGSNEYEDINIMSKGNVNETSAEKMPSECEEGTSDKNDDYESFRDLRFSSISIYDKPHFEEDIVITVEDAQRHAAESFVSYKVITKTTRESFHQHEFHVRRRYQDFLWLSNTLSQQYSSHIIPPLPQKKLFNRYDPSFLRLRQLALNKFLCRIAEHPILSTSEHFFTFLSAKQVALTEQKKATPFKKFQIPQIPITVTDSPFKSTSEYIEEFGKILSSLSTHSVKLDKEQTEELVILKTLSPCAALWANAEGDLEPILTKLGDCVTKTVESMEVLVGSKEEIFTESIKEYQLYVNLVRGVLKSRDHMQVTRDYYTDAVLSKQKDLEKIEAAEPGKSIATFFGKSPSQVKEEKIEKLKKEISTLSSDGEAAGDELVVTNATIKSDIERWKINKEKDCKILLSSVAETHITYYTESAKNWQSLMDFIDSIGSYD